MKRAQVRMIRCYLPEHKHTANHDTRLISQSTMNEHEDKCEFHAWDDVILRAILWL